MCDSCEISYHTFRRVEFVDEIASSSRSSKANTFGLSINSRGNGFLRISNQLYVKKKLHSKNPTDKEHNYD